MDHLAEEGYDVWALDIEGYGRSDKPETHNLDTQVAVEDTRIAVRSITQHRGARNLNLLGFSWGTQIAGLLTTRSPELVRRLILYAPISEAIPWMQTQRPHPCLPAGRSERDVSLEGGERGNRRGERGM